MASLPNKGDQIAPSDKRALKSTIKSQEHKLLQRSNCGSIMLWGKYTSKFFHEDFSQRNALLPRS